MNNRRVALILHGWPGPNTAGFSLCQLLKSNGYQLIIPKLMAIPSLPYTMEKMVNIITTALNDRKPNIIIGISMGGLLLPHIAKDYSKAKLIFIASGTKLKPIGTANLYFTLLKSVIGRQLITFSYCLPEKLIAQIYLLGRITQGGNKQEALLDLRENLNATKKYPPENHHSLINCLVKVDNTKLVSSLPNQTLIFAGTKDVFFPPEISNQLHPLLINRDVVWTARPHFCVFGKKELPHVEKFIT